MNLDIVLIILLIIFYFKYITDINTLNRKLDKAEKDFKKELKCIYDLVYYMADKMKNGKV